MTENDIKQSLSFHYIGLIATYSGYRFDKPFTDYGVDAVLEKVEKVSINGKSRFIASGKSIDVQLKSTSSAKIIRTEKGIKFDLEAKNYNDLVRRFQQRNKEYGYLIPLVLIVFILPENKENWLNILEDSSTKIEGYAYWIYPNDTWNFSTNSSTVRIEIPFQNKVDLNFCDDLFGLIYEK
ncbi:MAG: DUF4365 domain-containing protein [Bacteroidota bacterium]